MSKTKFIHLHVHSHYSLLDGLSKIPELVSKAKEFNMPALALTDHGNMYGAIEFYEECQKQAIKPIIGCEVYIAPRNMQDKQAKIDTRPYHLVLLAKNLEGYKNLIYLVSQAHLTGYYYKPRIDKKILKEHTKGLIATSACLNGEIPRLILSDKPDVAEQTIKFYKNIFGDDNFYLEIQYHPKLIEQNIVNKKILELSKKTKTKVILTNDSHYLEKEDQKAHEVLLSVQTGKDFDDKARLSMVDIDASFYSPEYAQKILSDHPEVIENTLEIAQKCNLKLDLGKNILPEFEIPKNEQDSFSYLKKLTLNGFKYKYLQKDNVAKKRLDYELQIIKKTGFADYFLIVSDFINWAKNQGIIVGPGRGSAAGSIVSYCLGITDLEPLSQNLIFERFLNPERISMPDIDIDFADDRRGEVIKYVQNKYGENHVAQIITFGTMAARGSIRDTARSLGFSYDQGDKIAKLVPFGMSLNQSMQEVAELKDLYNQDVNTKEIIDYAKKLEGVARHAGTHACGVVISKKPLIEYCPLQTAAKGETNITTQYSMKYIEDIGLLKIDFLGLSNLTVIKNALKIINKIHNTKIEIDKIPINDKPTFTLLSRAQTTGIFQLESNGMKRYLKQLKPNCFDDIIAMVALYRPGPIELIPDFIDRKHGKKQIKYLHPKLEPILKNTYGIAVYQEQIMQTARELAGFSMSEADVLRKAVGKKIKSLLQKQKSKLINGMVKNKIPQSVAIKIWQYIEPFAKYGFNKSHAACYALIAYQTAYLKAHYPKEFMAALLTSDFGNLDRVAIEIEECTRLGIQVIPPDVNTSFEKFGVIPDKNNISFGLEAIKGVGQKVAQLIVEERKKNGKYESLEDFCSRLGPEVINKKTIESLAKSGALDKIGERNQIIGSVDIICKFANQLSKNKIANQASLFADNTQKNQLIKLSLNSIDKASKNQRLSWEREFLGIYLSDHPLLEYKEIMRQFNSKDINLLRSNEQNIRIAGVITSIKKITTKKGEPMIFANIEDFSGKIEALVFPKILKDNDLIWKVDNILAIKGKVNSKDGNLKLIVEKCKELTEIKKQHTVNKERKLVISLLQNANLKTLQEIKNILKEFPGKETVILKIIQNHEEKIVIPKIKINITKQLISELDKIQNIKSNQL